MAKLFFNYATMNAGKSALLLQANHNYTSSGMRTLLMTSVVDDRTKEGHISSRIGLREEAFAFTKKCNLLSKISQEHSQGDKTISCVFVDEAQFLSPEQVRQLAKAVDRFSIPVMAYGLRTDFRGDPFPGSMALLAIADELREIISICHCGRKATMVMRKGADGKAVVSGDQIQIGDVGDRYVSLCREHWAEATGL